MRRRNRPAARTAPAVATRPTMGMAIIAAAALSAAGGVATARPADTDYLEDAPVAYRANVVVRAGGMVFRGRLHHRPGMQRREFDGAGGVEILRFDRNLAWRLSPARRTWRQASLSGVGLLNRAQLALVERRREAFAGRAVRVFDVSGRFVAGARLRGRVWLDARYGILLKAVLRISGKDWRRHYRLDLSHVAVAPQPQYLFEIPRGFVRAAAAPQWSRAAINGGSGAQAGKAPPAGRGASGSESLEDIFRK